MDNSHFLDRQAPIAMTPPEPLPHWDQEGKLQFVTFRLRDSLPQSVVADVKYRQELFIRQNPYPWDESTLLHFRAIGAPLEGRDLDRGYGECLLRRPEIREILMDVLLTGHGIAFDLWEVVVMPNHLHMIIKPYDGHLLRQIIGNIKSVTSHRVNALLGRRGSIWQPNFHDRIIRDIRHLENCQSYIALNPRFLPPTDFTHLRLQKE